MKICCILPYSPSVNRNFYERDILIQSGLYELEAAIGKLGLSVLLLDYLSDEQSNPHDLNVMLQQFQPDVLCIDSFICFEDYLWLYERLSLSFQSLPHIVFGTGALDYSKVLSEYAMVDYVVPACPEIAIPNLLYRMEHQLPFDQLKGVAYRWRGGVTYKRITEAKTDILFPPMDIKKYISGQDPATAFYYSSKGCWYGKCKFCTVGAAYQEPIKWIPCNLERVYSDVTALYNSGVRSISFLDDQFIGPGRNGYNRALMLSNYLSKFPDLKFTIRTRITAFDNQLLDKLIDAGLTCVFIGIESCNDRFLQLIHKGMTFKDIEKQWNYLIQSPLKVVPGMLLAHPMSRLSDIREHLTGLMKLYRGHYEKMDIQMLFHELHLHAGTPIYKETYTGYNEKLPSECTCPYFDPLVSRCVHHFRVLYREVEKNLESIQSGSNKSFVRFSTYRLKVHLFRWLIEITQFVETKEDLEIEGYIKTVVHEWRYGFGQ